MAYLVPLKKGDIGGCSSVFRNISLYTPAFAEAAMRRQTSKFHNAYAACSNNEPLDRGDFFIDP